MDEKVTIRQEVLVGAVLDLPNGTYDIKYVRVKNSQLYLMLETDKECIENARTKSGADKA